MAPTSTHGEAAPTAAAHLPQPCAGPVYLLTNPTSVGYHQNPISVYFCYSADMRLRQCIAEVTNTPWGERVTFLFDPQGTHAPKALHVSPMMDMKNTW